MQRILFLVFAFSSTLGDQFSVGNKLFTGSVYNELLVNKKDNILVSPFSAETILALTQSGAQGDTGSEIRSTLHLPGTKNEAEAIFKEVLPTIESDTFLLKTANKIYVENNYPVKESFKAIASDIYQASVQNIDFSEQKEAAEEINDWVAEQTNDKITKLLSNDDLSTSTKVVLVNALYFQANWTIPFFPRLTKKANFFTSSNVSVDAVMMYKESEYFNYAESEELDAKILEIPFQGEGASMVFILPNKKEGINLLEKQTASILMTPTFIKEFVEVYLPKFQIESTIDFIDILQDLGMHKAFDPALADFSSIAGQPGELFIGKVKQKTFIDVNEIGVEAAAATVVGEPDSISPTPAKVFNADHPFVFYIKVKDVILFEGRVLLPKYDN